MFILLSYSLMLGLGLGLGLRLGLVLGLGSSRNDLDDHYRWLQPIDLNLDLLGIAHLDNESSVQRQIKNLREDSPVHVFNMSMQPTQCRGGHSSNLRILG